MLATTLNLRLSRGIGGSSTFRGGGLHIWKTRTSRPKRLNRVILGGASQGGRYDLLDWSHGLAAASLVLPLRRMRISSVAVAPAEFAILVVDDVLGLFPNSGLPASRLGGGFRVERLADMVGSLSLVCPAIAMRDSVHWGLAHIIFPFIKNVDGLHSTVPGLQPTRTDAKPFGQNGRGYRLARYGLVSRGQVGGEDQCCCHG